MWSKRAVHRTVAAAAIALVAGVATVHSAPAQTVPIVEDVGGILEGGSPPSTTSPPPTSPPTTQPKAEPAKQPSTSPAGNAAPMTRRATTAPVAAAPVASAPAEAEHESAAPVADPVAEEVDDVALAADVPVTEAAAPPAFTEIPAEAARQGMSAALPLLAGVFIGITAETLLRRQRARFRGGEPDDRSCALISVRGSSRRARNVQAVAVFALALGGVVALTALTGGGIRRYGFIALGYLIVKLALSGRYRPHTGDESVSSMSIAAIVPVYNEDPDAFERCLDSLLAQSRPFAEIWVIDDGSSSKTCLAVARRVLAGVPGARVHAFKGNRGKREAQAYAFRRSTADVFCTIDSDTVLEPDAVEEGIKPFANPKITAVTGNVRALNHRKNLLTKLIDLRYANAFLYERAAYSMLGSVLCACGSLSFWRSDVIKENLDDFVNQTFLGIPVQYGDDRRLTNYALQRGKVVVQDSSVAYTVVPERVTHFVRQQLRWNKSFFRETLWVLRNFTPKRWVWWLSLAEIVVWAALSAGIVMATVVTPLLTGRLAVLYYLSYVAVMSYARSVRYLGASEASWAYQLYVFALSPVYAVMHVGLLIPLRIWSLCTLRQKGWGTRGTVEVALNGDGAPAVTVAAAPAAVAA